MTSNTTASTCRGSATRPSESSRPTASSSTSTPAATASSTTTTPATRPVSATADARLRPEDGDIVCVTHIHHYDPDGIRRVASEDATVVAFEGINVHATDRDLDRLADLDYEVRKVSMEADVLVDDVPIWTMPAYNHEDGRNLRTTAARFTRKVSAAASTSPSPTPGLLARRLRRARRPRRPRRLAVRRQHRRLS